MKTYYITILLVFIFTYLAQRYDFRQKVDADGNIVHSKATRNFYLISAGILIFVAGFRYYVGTDFGGYYLFGSKYASGLIDSIIRFDEPGIRVIYFLIRLFTKQNFIPIFVFSLITIGVSLYVIYKNTNCLIMAVLLFIFLGCWHVSFNAVRQCLAATVIFCGYNALKEKNFKKYVLYVFIAFLFHRSAVIMIAPYFVTRNKINFRNIFILIVFSIVTLLSYEQLFSFTEFVLQDSLSEDNVYATAFVSFFRIAVAIAPALFFILLYWGRELNKHAAFNIKLLVIHAVVMVMASKSTMLARAGIYTAPFCVIAIPELNKPLKKKTRVVINIIILGLYAFYFFYEIKNSSSLNDFRWVFGVM